MFAASSLVVAVLATYASVAVLSLSASAPSFLGNLPGVAPLVTGLGWSQPSVGSLAELHNPSSGATLGALADTNLIDFGSLTDPRSPRAFSITNNSSTPIAFTVTVVGSSAHGVTAQFANQSRKQMVAPRKQATVFVTSSAAYAGPIVGKLVISAPGLTPLSVLIQGDQAPLAPGSVTATPAAQGAVDLSWAPSGSISGVAGYILTRSSGGSTPEPVSGLISGTSMVDHPPTDGTYAYQVIAVADGGGALRSAPGGVGSVTTDSTPPDAPNAFGALPQFINAQTVDQALNVNVQLPGGSQASDTITVTAKDSSGATFTQSASGGGATAQVQFDPAQFAQGNVNLSAIATDAAGNPSTALTANNAFFVDTVAPDAPSSVSAPATIAGGNDKNLPIQVDVPSTDDPSDPLIVSLLGVTGPAQPSPFHVSDADAPLLVDASGLPDGIVTVSAWVVDEAGNRSAVVTADPSPVKDTIGSPAPASIGVAAGPDNPVNVVTAASQNAVIVQATFDQAPPATDTLVFWVAGTKYTVQPDGQATTITLPAIDMSGLQDGVYHVGLVETDADGNATKTFTHFTKDVSGPESATSVGVPAGPSNPAGYVNAATQTAATIVATFAGPTDPADQIALSVGGLALAPQSGGSAQAVFTADLSGLPDGTLPIDGTITDPSGVTTTFSGTLIKDTQAPLAPFTAYVDGPPPNTITHSGAACVNVTVLFNQAPDPSDMVTVSLSDENTSVQGSAPAGDGQVHIGCIDASALSAGTIAVNVTVTDAAGNSASMAGTSATKLDCPPS